MTNGLNGNLHVGVAETGNTATVLLADDDEEIRRMVASVLRQHGFTVLEAADGLEALAVAQRHAAPIRLLLTDWKMPRLTGGELIRRVRKDRPETSVLVMTGDLYLETLASGRVLRKPFKIQNLMDAVSEAIGNKADKRLRRALQ